MSSLVSKLETVVRRHEEIQALLADHPEPGGADYTKLTREYSEMSPVVEEMRAFQKAVQDLEDARALAVSEDDPEMRAMAEEEARELQGEIEATEQKMKVLVQEALCNSTAPPANIPNLHGLTHLSSKRI